MQLCHRNFTIQMSLCSDRIDDSTLTPKNRCYTFDGLWNGRLERWDLP